MRSTSSLWAIVAFAAFAGCKEPITRGGKCTMAENTRLVGCIDPATAAQCLELRLHAFPCRGPSGCKPNGERNAACDTSLGQENDPCMKPEIHAQATCTPSKTAKLACRNGKLVLDRVCRGPKGCDPTWTDDSPLACDRSVARLADPCQTDSLAGDTNEVCSDDAKSSLECDADKDGKFVTARLCSGPKGCSMVDGLARCDVSVATAGAACGKNNQSLVSCDRERAVVLQCSDGTWKPLRTCGKGTRCKPKPNAASWQEVCIESP